MKASEVVIALANMASQGKYDNVTPQGAKNMNEIFERVAELINSLEAAENPVAEEAVELEEGFPAEDKLELVKQQDEQEIQAMEDEGGPSITPSDFDRPSFEHFVEKGTTSE